MRSYLSLIQQHFIRLAWSDLHVSLRHSCPRDAFSCPKDLFSWLVDNCVMLSPGLPNLIESLTVFVETRNICLFMSLVCVTATLIFNVGSRIVDSTYSSIIGRSQCRVLSYCTTDIATHTRSHCKTVPLTRVSDVIPLANSHLEQLASVILSHMISLCF